MLSAVIRSALSYPAFTMGTITGTPEVRPSRSSHSRKRSSQCSNARHTCYNGRDKRLRSREGELTPKTHPQFGLQAATPLHEAGIASNRRQPYGREFVPGLVHTARHTMGAGHARSRYLTARRGMPKGLVTGVKS
ncbi:hypothetical protein Sango_2925000 [Sesamum angolense]|uniref:Uncharacterized protein n=1 Tax=Sesamum angolense TaxID=2727404 RepID=A0AAE1T437_9LAMI|nr:hypothetical protein Sango_2925000 [Sesamum angolense]